MRLNFSSLSSNPVQQSYLKQLQDIFDTQTDDANDNANFIAALTKAAQKVKQSTWDDFLSKPVGSRYKSMSKEEWESLVQNALNENKKIKNNKMEDKKIIKILQQLEEAVDKDEKKKAIKKSKTQLKENWIIDLLHSTQHVGNWGEGGGMDMTVGQLTECVLWLLGIGVGGTLALTWQKILHAVKQAPAKIKQVTRALKAVKDQNFDELASMGIDKAKIAAAAKKLPQRQLQTSEVE